MVRKKYFAIRWKSGKVEIEHDIWDNVREKVEGVSGITYKSFNDYEAALEWTRQEPIPYRKVGDPLQKDKLYLFVDGSYSPNIKVAGWGWVAVINDVNIGFDYGTVKNKDLLSSRNIAGELQATIEAAKWYHSHLYPKYLKPIIVHDYAGIGNWALGYWDTHKPVSNAYKEQMFEYDGYFKFEKISGHTGDRWNEYADQLASLGCKSEKISD